MDRRRKGAIGMAAVALLWVGSRMVGGGAAPEASVIQVVASEPLRVAAGTPLDGYRTDAVAQDELALPEGAKADDLAAADPLLPEALPEPVAALDPCAGALEAFAEEGAMIGLTLVAPCQPDAQVELRHAGLVVAMRTLATGSLFTELPAMDAKGEVEAVFADGTALSAAAPVPELAALRRFAVQWQDADRFALNAFERGADYGDVGHLTAANGGVMALGDPAEVPARLAEVYTFPDPEEARVTVEAEVTEATCGRALAGQTVYSQNGMARLTELSLGMPECDAAGGFVVLNNPLPDTTLAAAE